MMERTLILSCVVKGFRKLIDEHDAIVISFAEHNGSYTAAWKNIFDWISRIDQNVWQDTPLVMLAATPGPRAGAGVLGAATSAAPHFGGQLKSHFGVGSFYQTVVDGQITDDNVRDGLSKTLSALAP